MGNQQPTPRVEVVTYQEPYPPYPPPEPVVEVDVTVNSFGDVIETETVVVPGPYADPYDPQPATIVVEENYGGQPAVEVTTYPYGNPSGYVEYRDQPYPDTQPYPYDPEPAPVVVEEYYGGEPEVEVTSYPYDNPSGYVEYEGSYPDDEPYCSDDLEPYQ